MDARPVPVPDTCFTAYVVMTPDPIGPDDHVPLPLESLLRRRGSSDQSLQRLPAFTHQRVMSARASCDEIAEVARALRVEALELAARHHGLVLDLEIPRVVEHTADEASLVTATQWFATDAEDVTGETLTLLTSGLGVFGLPDLAWPGVPHDRHAMYSAVVTGLVHRLLQEWPEHDPVGPATVTLRDIAYGLGDAGAGSVPRDRAIGLVIDHDADAGRLTVWSDEDPAVVLFG